MSNVNRTEQKETCPWCGDGGWSSKGCEKCIIEYMPDEPELEHGCVVCRQCKQAYPHIYHHNFCEYCRNPPKTRFVFIQRP